MICAGAVAAGSSMRIALCTSFIAVNVNRPSGSWRDSDSMGPPFPPTPPGSALPPPSRRSEPPLVDVPVIGRAPAVPK